MKNRKGYMLVEIVLASAIAFGVAFFIVSLTIKLKNKNDDVLVSSQVSVDQAIITNKFMTYAIDEQGNFDCKQIAIRDNVITYRGKTIDIVNDYANISTYSCSNSNGTIKISMPVEILQLKNKDYNISVEYKYIIGDLAVPRVSVSVRNGTTYSKSKTGTITLSDNENLKNGTYKIKYGWSTGYLSCDKMTKELTYNVSNQEKEITKEVTISNENGAGRLYACNIGSIPDLYDNELPVNVVVNDYMYLDNTGPVIALGSYSAGTISNSTTVQIKVSDTLSGVAYNSFTKDDLDVYIASTKINNISLTHTGSGNYNLVVNANNSYDGKLSINIASGKVTDNAGNGNSANQFSPNITFARTRTCSARTYYNGSSKSCATCPAGYYCPGWTGIPDSSNHGIAVCGPGKTSGTGAASCSTCSNSANVASWSGNGCTISTCNGGYVKSGNSCVGQCTSTYIRYGGWYVAGGCSASCGGGSQTIARSRTWISNYNGANCGSDTEYSSQSCNTQSCSCTVYCTSPSNCSKVKPTAWDDIYGAYTCTSGRTGRMQSCWVGTTKCDGGSANRGWSWMCTSGELTHMFNWGGLHSCCNSSLGWPVITANTLSTAGGYSCSCD